MKLFKIIMTSIFMIFIFSPAKSQEINKIEETTINYKENFSNEDISVILGGQINLQNSKSKWHVYLSNQKLVMKNEHEPNSLHYDDIEWVKYSGSKVLSSAKGATISVTIEANNDGRGAAGIIVGSGERGFYWMFGVDGQGRFHLIKKAGRKTYHAHTGVNENIIKGKPNRISYKTHKNNIVFFVNKTEMIQVPLGRLKTKSYKNIEMPGIGLAAFGIGTYIFDDVEIRPNN